jgi:uncharacterized protein
MIRFISVLLILTMLFSCGRSKDVQFYTLKPSFSPPKQIIHAPFLRIGINKITIPIYLEKKPFAIFYSSNHLSLDEYQQWIEPLNKSIPWVIKTDLETLLPHATIKNAPWSMQFNPTYSLTVHITQFKVNVTGESVLRAEYLIYKKDHVEKKITREYKTCLPKPSVEAYVVSMNKHLGSLAVDIAGQFKSIS